MDPTDTAAMNLYLALDDRAKRTPWGMLPAADKLPYRRAAVLAAQREAAQAVAALTFAARADFDRARPRPQRLTRARARHIAWDDPDNRNPDGYLIVQPETLFYFARHGFNRPALVHFTEEQRLVAAALLAKHEVPLR